MINHTNTTALPNPLTHNRQRKLSSVLGALSYFEIFQYPLTAAEVFQFSCLPDMQQNEVENLLEEGVAAGLIFKFGNYYQTVDSAVWGPERKALNDRADSFLPMACRMGRLIGQFPFIRGVMVSGSLSKHTMRDDGDIDFFLVTAPGRLWLARTLLVLFKKIFLLNSRKYFCVNYFIDADHLEIEEKNLFTATECATLLPVYGSVWYEQFMQSNTWVRTDFLPHFLQRATKDVPESRTRGLKFLLEKTLNTRLGTLLDRWAMRITLSFWKRKFRHFDPSQFDLALKSRKYVSKHHPLAFQEKVLLKYKDLMAMRSSNCEHDV